MSGVLLILKFSVLVMTDKCFCRQQIDILANNDAIVGGNSGNASIGPRLPLLIISFHYLSAAININYEFTANFAMTNCSHLLSHQSDPKAQRDYKIINLAIFDVKQREVCLLSGAIML